LACFCRRKEGRKGGREGGTLGSGAFPHLQVTGVVLLKHVEAWTSFGVTEVYYFAYFLPLKCTERDSECEKTLHECQERYLNTNENPSKTGQFLVLWARSLILRQLTKIRKPAHPK
jgi:hypothetical protein